jgi:hypothetical protein
MLPAAAVIAAVSADYQLKQQFYDAVHAKNYTSAINYGRTYLELHPDDDRFSLDYAYAELSAGKRADATARLQHLTHSSDAYVSDSAKRQLKPVRSSYPCSPGRIFLRLFGS